MKHDRKRQAALQDVGWTVIAIVFEDVRYRSWDFVGRIDRHLNRAAA
jgi:very-short-patch-repair endonuclease